MREMSYMVKLTDWYKIQRGIGLDCYDDTIHLPGIKMSVEWRGMKGDFMEYLGPCEIDSEIKSYLPQILEGKKTPWELDCVQVGSDSIILEFEKSDLIEVSSTGSVRITLPRYCENGSQRLPRMILHFEVPLPDQLGASTTLVETDAYGAVIVSELGERSRREVLFLERIEDANPHEYEGSSRQGFLVEVTDITW